MSYLVNHPCFESTLILLCPCSLETECGWRETTQLMLPGLILNSSPNLRAVLVLPCSHTAFPRSIHSPTLTGGCRILFPLSSNLHTSYTVLTLCLLFFIEEKKQSGKNTQHTHPAQTLCTAPTPLPVPLFSVFLSAPVGEQPGLLTQPLYCALSLCPIPVSPTQQHPGPWIYRHSRHSAWGPPSF